MRYRVSGSESPLICYNSCYSAYMVKRSGRAPRGDVKGAAESTLVASRALVGVAARSLASIEGIITLIQYRALVLLATRGNLNVGSIAEALGVHASTATRLCDRLVQRRLIERRTSVESRREVVIGLTASGRALVRSVTDRRRREITKIIGRLDPKQREQLTAAFAAFADAAGESPDSAWKLGWTQ